MAPPTSNNFSGTNGDPNGNIHVRSQSELINRPVAMMPAYETPHMYLMRLTVALCQQLVDMHYLMGRREDQVTRDTVYAIDYATIYIDNLVCTASLVNNIERLAAAWFRGHINVLRRMLSRYYAVNRNGPGGPGAGAGAHFGSSTGTGYGSGTRTRTRTRTGHSTGAFTRTGTGYGRYPAAN